MSASKCPRCEQTVYPVEGLKCLDKVWHKGCFKCHECNMTLSLKNYKGFEKRPYCNAHCPQAKATTVADTPESRRLAENTRIQSQAKYHEDFEKSKGKGFTTIADDPETVRAKNTSKIISNVAYHGEMERKKHMEEMRGKGDQTDISHRLAHINLHDKDEKSQQQSRAHGMKVPLNPQHLNNQQTNQQSPLHHQQQALKQHHQQQQQQQQKHQNYIKDNRQYVVAPNQAGTKINNNNIEPQMQKSLNQYPQSSQQHQIMMMQQHQMQHQRPIEESVAYNNAMMSRPAQVQPNSSPNHQQIVKQQQMQAQQLSAMRGKQAQMSPQSYPIKYPSASQLPAQQMPPQAMTIQGIPAQMVHIPRLPNNVRIPVSAVPTHLPQMAMPMVYHAQLGPMPNGVMGKQQQQYFVHMPPNMIQGPIPQIHAMNQIRHHPQLIQQQQQQHHQHTPKRIFRAMYDYVAQDIDEVSFMEGDLLVNCVNVDTGWMTGTVQRSGQSGMLPANYVEQVRIKA